MGRRACVWVRRSSALGWTRMTTGPERRPAERRSGGGQPFQAVEVDEVGRAALGPDQTAALQLRESTTQGLRAGAQVGCRVLLGHRPLHSQASVVTLDR